jgi:hypothetical protein
MSDEQLERLVEPLTEIIKQYIRLRDTVAYTTRMMELFVSAARINLVPTLEPQVDETIDACKAIVSESDALLDRWIERRPEYGISNESDGGSNSGDVVADSPGDGDDQRPAG